MREIPLHHPSLTETMLPCYRLVSFKGAILTPFPLGSMRGLLLVLKLLAHPVALLVVGKIPPLQMLVDDPQLCRLRSGSDRLRWIPVCSDAWTPTRRVTNIVSVGQPLLVAAERSAMNIFGSEPGGNR